MWGLYAMYPIETDMAYSMHTYITTCNYSTQASPRAECACGYSLMHFTSLFITLLEVDQLRTLKYIKVRIGLVSFPGPIPSFSMLHVEKEQGAWGRGYISYAFQCSTQKKLGERV